MSEDVLSLVEGRYGFSHELFFDYCFARGFIRQGTTLTTFLLNSEQHLFHRAQVRQILAYLRDDDYVRYSQDLCSLLANQKIRPHLKDVTLAWVFSLQDPQEYEWEVLAPWVETELDAIKHGKPNPNKLATLIWSRFFTSPSWFQFADQKGLVADWLNSDCDRITDQGTKYVRMHQRFAGDRVAALLEPFVNRGGNWPQRLTFVMQSAQLEHSRRFFELFLKLIDNGTLDNFRSPFASNGIFWSKLANLGTQRPIWIAEVMAQWLYRRLSIVSKTRDDAGQPKWHLVSNRDQLGPEILKKAAIKTPEAFVQHVLPAVLKIANHASYKHDHLVPKRDAVWNTISLDDQSSMAQACINALSMAVEKLSERKSICVEAILSTLRQHTTNTSNFILLRAYAAGAKYLADEAVSVLCDEPWRFECRYADNPNWESRKLVGAIVRHCTEQSRAKLEKAVLAYNPLYDRSQYAYKQMGKATYELLSSFPPDLRSQLAQKRYLELERKFMAPQPPPQKSRVYRVGSPIKESDAKKMTDEQWLRAIEEYDTEEGKNRWEYPGQGGALQLARTLKDRVKQEPKRFAQLSLNFPPDTHHEYMEYTLSGLKDSKGLSDLKLDVCRKAFGDAREIHGKAIADLLGSIEDPLPEDAVQMLDWLASKHPDPHQELRNKQASISTTYYERDILAHGINTTRGRTAWAITNILLRDYSQIQRFWTIIEHLINDNTVAVRSCAATILLAIFDKEPELAIEQFLTLVEPRGDPNDEDRLLATRDVRRFFQYGIYQYFEILRPVIERMLRSDFDETSNLGAWLVSMAALIGHESAGLLAEEASIGNSSQRLGVVQVAAANIGQTEHRCWSEEKLLKFFDDSDSKVRQEAASCFRNLRNQSLKTYENLIGRFCHSTAYDDDSFHLLSVLEHTSDRLPRITLTACRKFFERFGTEANDIRTSRSIDGSIFAKLILRTYHQHLQDEWAVECLELIDQMCLAEFYEIRSILDDYERLQ